MRALKIFQDRAIKAEQDAGAEMFMGLPDNWYEPRPQYGCENGHVSGIYIKSELRGHLCPACQTAIAMIPHGYTDETLAAALDSIRAESTPASQPSPAAAQRAAERIEAMHKGVVGVFTAIKAEHAPSQATTDCRSPEGIATGLIDGVIAIARVLRSADQNHPAVVEALKDLRSDEDVSALLATQATPAGEAQEHDDDERCAECGLNCQPGNCVYGPAERAPSGEAVTTWEKHYALGSSKEGAMLFEIRDLRAALARRATAGNAAPVYFFRQKGTDRWIESEADPRESFANSPAQFCMDYRTLYASNAATAAPGDLTDERIIEIRNAVGERYNSAAHVSASGAIEFARRIVSEVNASNAGAAPLDTDQAT